jgi:hypothetical protein
MQFVWKWPKADFSMPSVNVRFEGGEADIGAVCLFFPEPTRMSASKFALRKQFIPNSPPLYEPH